MIPVSRNSNSRPPEGAASCRDGSAWGLCGQSLQGIGSSFPGGKTPFAKALCSLYSIISDPL